MGMWTDLRWLTVGINGCLVMTLIMNLWVPCKVGNCDLFENDCSKELVILIFNFLLQMIRRAGRL